VAKDKKAYGALSIDSELPFAFFGKGVEVAIDLEPYIALLACTYAEPDPSVDCGYEPSHIARSGG